jgi:hypothetical protein
LTAEEVVRRIAAECAYQEILGLSAVSDDQVRRIGQRANQIGLVPLGTALR